MHCLFDAVGEVQDAPLGEFEWQEEEGKDHVEQACGGGVGVEEVHDGREDVEDVDDPHS